MNSYQLTLVGVGIIILGSMVATVHVIQDYLDAWCRKKLILHTTTRLSRLCKTTLKNAGYEKSGEFTRKIIQDVTLLNLPLDNADTFENELMHCVKKMFRHHVAERRLRQWSFAAEVDPIRDAMANQPTIPQFLDAYDEQRRIALEKIRKEVAQLRLAYREFLSHTRD